MLVVQKHILFVVFLSNFTLLVLNITMKYINNTYFEMPAPVTKLHIYFFKFQVLLKILYVIECKFESLHPELTSGEYE